MIDDEAKLLDQGTGRPRGIVAEESGRRHRERLRQQGLRPIQIWVPDVRASSFRAEAHRQSLAVTESPYAAEDQDFIEAVSDLDE